MPNKNKPLLDLARLAKGAGLDEKSFEHLFFGTENFSIKCNDQADTADPIRQLHARSKARRLNTGLSQLGIAYPLIVLPEGELLPLFVRMADLEASSKDYNSWTISANRQIFLPTHTKKLLREKGADIFLRQAEAELLHPNRKQKLHDLLLILAAETSWPVEEGKLHPLPEQPEQKLPSACVVHTALLGLFPPPTEAEYAEADMPEQPTAPAEQLKNRIDFELLAPPFAAALEATLEKPQTQIAFDQSQTANWLAFQLLGRLLSNGRSVLVISDKSQPLQNLQTKMQEKQLGHLSFLLRRPGEDEATLEQLHQAFAKSHPAGTYHPARKDELQKNIDHCAEIINQVTRRHQLLRKPQADGLCYEEWTGQFLSYRKQCGPEILNSVAALKELNFSAEEGKILSRELKKAERLFQKVRRARHPLSELHPEFFTDMSEPAARQKVEQRLDAFAERLHEIHHRLIHLQAQYRQKIRQHLEDNYLYTQNLMREILRDIQKGENQLGKTFKTNGLSMLKLKARLSKEQAKILKAREALLRKYTQLKEKLKTFSGLEIELPPAASSLLPRQISLSLKTTESKLENWRKARREEIEEHLIRLNGKTAWEEIKLTDEMIQLESDFDRLIDELNHSRLYHAQIENRVLTLTKRQQMLEQLLERLENTRQHLHEFPQLYKWQHFLLKLPGKSRKLILALARINPMNWHAAFLSWHYESLLTQHYHPLMRQELSSEDRENILTQSLHMQALLPEYIKLIWQQKILEQKKRKPEKKQQKTKQWAAYFPLLLLNAFSAAHLFPSLAKAYDYVLLLDYGELPESWTKIVRAYGLPHSLWKIDQRAESEIKIKESPNNAKTSSPPIQSIPANGHLEKDGLNLAEADQLIQLLNPLQPSEGKNYPRLAMVTFCETQRTRINDYLRRLQMQKENQAFFTELLRRGLGVFLPDELPGMEYDLLLVSLCYDETKLNSKKSKQIIQQWHIIQEVADKGIYLVHSLNENHPLLQTLCSKEEQMPGQREEKQTLPCPTLLKLLKEEYQQKYGKNKVHMHKASHQMGLKIKTESKTPETLLLIDGLLAASAHSSPLWEWQTRRILEQMGYRQKNIFVTDLWMQPDRHPIEIK